MAQRPYRVAGHAVTHTRRLGSSVVISLPPCSQAEGTPVILTSRESQALLSPHCSAVWGWHADAYKRRDEVRSDKADQWADQDAATRGKWVTNLVVAAARDDEADGRSLIRLQGFEGVAVQSDGRLAAQLRFRTVAMEPNEYGDEVPVISAPLTDTAQQWIGNGHLSGPGQRSLLGEPDERPHTNLLVGRVSDPLTGDLRRIVVACWWGKRLYWWRDIDAGGTVQRMTARPRTGGPTAAPIITPKRTQPKRERQ